MINSNFIFLGIALQALGGVGYLIDTIKGRAKPNKVSWLLWAIAPLIAFVAQIKQGVGIISLATFIVGFVPLCIFITSLFIKKAEWKLNKLDYFCGILSALGLILWSITKIGNLAIFFSILADGLASIPTVIKSFFKPESENDLVYLGGFINSAIALLTIRKWNFEHFSFPAYLLFLNLIVFILIRFKLGKNYAKK